MNKTRNGALIVRIGKRVRQLREQQEKSLNDLALECEIEKQQVYRIEHGKVNVTISTLELIARALDVSLAELLEDL